MADGIVQRYNVPAAGLNPFVLYDFIRDFEWDGARQFRIFIRDDVGAVIRDIRLEWAAGRRWPEMWRDEVWPLIMASSESPIWETGWEVVVQRRIGTRFRPVDLQQRFRDGETHCVLTPMRTYYETKRATSGGEATQRKCTTYLDRLVQLEKQYADGVPESALEYVARRLAVRITLSDPLGKNERRFNDEFTRGKTFVFRNVRFNHVQEIACETEVVALPAEGMMSQLQMLRENRHFYVYKRSGVGQLPTRIDSFMGRVSLEDPDRDVFQAARDAYKLDGSAVDALKEPELASFLAASLRVTSHARFHLDEEFENDPADYKIVDLSRAYTRAEDCGPYYAGYLTSISDVRVVTGGIAHVRAHPGVYSVRDISLAGCAERVFDYATQLALRPGSNLILPSPELLWWWDHGVRFTVAAGAWGSVLPSIDWEGQGLLEKGVGPLHLGTARYKIWCGQLGYSNRGTKAVFLPGDARWAAVLEEAGYRVNHYPGDPEVCVKVPAEKTPELKHVLAFITAYTRINVLNKLLEFDVQQVRGVMLDAILYVGDGAVTDERWRAKPDVDRRVLTEYSRDGWYATDGIWADRATDDWITAGATSVMGPLTFLEGAGGSGKSHSVLADPGFRDVLFAAPTWSLVCFMMRKYGVAGTTAHRLAGSWIDVDSEGKETRHRCRPYHEEYKKYPAVVFVDEATMIDRSMLDSIVATYKGKSKIILAGDIRVTGIPADKPPVWFQCRNRTTVFDPREARCAVVSFASDYRASGELVDKKRELREAMLAAFLDSAALDPGDDPLDAHLVHTAARTIFASSLCTAETCAAEYTRGDTILAGTHDLADAWGELLKDRDARYRVTSHTSADVAAATRGENVSLTGDIVDEKGDRAAVFALAFTIHSFQGKTFTGNRLWIDARRAWDYAMLYTAISRCQTISQIRIFFE